MTANESILMDMDTFVSRRVKMSNGQLTQARGRGTLVVETKKGRRFIREVLLVPELDQNLLSVGQLQEKGPRSIVSRWSLQDLSPSKRYDD